MKTVEFSKQCRYRYDDSELAMFVVFLLGFLVTL